MAKNVKLLWFKRDLRTLDHEALAYCLSKKSKIIAFYIFEPIIENNYDFDIRHWFFVYHSLLDIQKKIPIHILYGDSVQIIENLMTIYPKAQLVSHKETGVAATFKRDMDIKSLTRAHRIKWKEFNHNHIYRGLKNRKYWDKMWIKKNLANIPSYKIDKKSFIELHLARWEIPQRVKQNILNSHFSIEPGENSAHKKLKLFLNEKVDGYFKHISYPEKSRYHCSLLSAHIAWGNISIRQIYQACKEHRVHIKNKMSIDQFMARIKWHCHFVQKFESECSIEYQNLNPSFNHIRVKKDKKKIKAWKEGQTGIPLIDAAMRCVNQTGYLNFRMRAMLVSFLTHHLWQPWQEGARHLARMFIDYEPGIHFSQFQMQAGTMGVHTIRVYNPIKQAKDKDAKAEFIKKWVPELKELPLKFIHEPWLMSPMDEIMYQFTLGQHYPAPIVDCSKASQEARDKLWSIKKSMENKLHARKILNKHVRTNKRYHP